MLAAWGSRDRSFESYLRAALAAQGGVFVSDEGADAGWWSARRWSFSLSFVFRPVPKFAACVGLTTQRHQSQDGADGWGNSR